MFAFLVAAAFAQDTITCEATDASELRYVEWHKSGGAAPRPDTAMDTTTWTIGERVLFERVETYSLGVPPRGRLDWEWLPEKTVVLGSTGGPVSGSTRYTTEVRLFTRDASPIGGPIEAHERIVPMRCERVTVCCVP